MNKKIIRLVISLVIIGGLAVGIFYAYLKTGTQNLSASLISIQENIAEVAATKEIGDLLAAKKTPPKKYTWQEVENLATAMANQIGSLKINYRLAEYKKAGTIWAVKIREAAKNTKTWKDIPADPGDFIVALRDKEAEELFNISLTNIFELIQFGNNAIERKDKETMRYVAAKLFVQKHWLNGLANHQKAGIFARLIIPAYAVEKNSLNELGREVDRVQGAIISLMDVALRYYVAENIDKDKAAAADWKKAVEEIVKIIAENDLGPQTLAALVQGMSQNTIPTDTKKTPTPQLPPKAQAFQDDCLARGGMLGGVSRTNNYLMTVEDGYYCKFQSDTQECWKFLSYSGSFANGGEADCEQENVLPAPTGPNEALAKTRPTGSGQAAPTPAAKTETKTPVKTPTQLPPVDFPETPTDKIYFDGPGYTLTGKVGDKFEHSFCYPDLHNVSDLCGTANTTVPSGGHPPYHFQLESGFPPFGLTLNLNGILNGTPTAEGTRDFKVCAVDLDGQSMCAPVKIEIKPETPYDGRYSMHESGDCGTRHEEMDFIITVTDGIVALPSVTDPKSKIDASGNSTFSGVSDDGMNYAVNLQFSKAGTGVNFSGNMRWSGNNAVNCSATISGSRQ